MGIDLDIDRECSGISLLWGFNLDFYLSLTVGGPRSDDTIQVS
jgi:hypothetical protein